MITTVVELIGSYIMEFTTGGWLWDYTRFPFNFEGRIALNPSIRFGIGGMIFLYLLQPVFVKISEKMPEKVFNAVTGIMAVIFLTDAAVHVIL